MTNGFICFKIKVITSVVYIDSRSKTEILKFILLSILFACALFYCSDTAMWSPSITAQCVFCNLFLVLLSFIFVGN